MSLQVCRINATKPAICTKEFWLSDGKLEKRTTAHVTEGDMEIISLHDIDGFAVLLDSLKENQCLTYGVPKHDAKLTTEEKWNELNRPSDYLPRSKSVFNWPDGSGILMLDYDAPKDGSDPLSKDQLLEATRSAIPEIDAADAIWYPSTSSCLYAGDKELVGVKGQRIYIMVKNAKDIERAGKTLIARLWAKGYGRYEVSTSGSLLERGLFDSSVWQSNRIDFAAGASCRNGLEQRRGSPELLKGLVGGPLDTETAIPDLTPEELAVASEAKRVAREVVKSVADSERSKWIVQRVAEIRTSSNVTEEHARMIATRAVEKRDLMGDCWIIIRGHYCPVK